MATKTAAKNSKKTATPHFTNYLTDVIDTGKDIVDDVLSTTSKVEKSVRTRSKDARDKLVPSEKDMKKLRKNAKELTGQVERLAKVRSTKSDKDAKSSTSK
ncbi:MAG: hypothetical protein FWF28_06980 [Micrococcales bacterium]|nr:hypothetical protein [Micrococcales bacterium]MCL2543638.1 hypothetical protein [Nocardioidaceae bacterium]MCL2614125.1 hypothetical protein [Nocardioidaceae bacterium]